MKKVLVLGGTRFFGRRLVEKLLAHNYDVTVATRGKTKDAFGDRVHRVTVDRSNPQSMKDAFQDTKWDIVYDNINYNTHDAKSAIDVFEGNVGRYVFTSTLSVYDFGGDAKVEGDFDPSTYAYDLNQDEFTYQEGKRQAEAIFEQTSAFSATYVRFPIVLGEDDYTKRLHFHVEHVLEGLPIGIPNQQASLSFITSQEAADFLFFAGHETFTGPVNACSNGAYSLDELITLIEEITGKQSRVVSSTEDQHMSPFGVPDNWTMNTQKAKDAGFTFLNLHEWMPALVKTLRKEYQ
ncbi:NAD-dependent epimerase/dehydratase family protein [Priestia koreensis]|uniref:NAD-dependent epimerase/dehydratase family protein n=1 Tax=Priestia koreensis TaxID=284581 RepID=UPI00345977C5